VISLFLGHGRTSRLAERQVESICPFDTSAMSTFHIRREGIKGGTRLDGVGRWRLHDGKRRRHSDK